MVGRRIVVLAVLATAVIGCASPSAPSESVTPSASSGAPAGLLPADCEPIDLRSPTGERVDLTGVWTGNGTLVDSDETIWLTQAGDCVFGSAMNPTFLEDQNPAFSTLATLAGRLTSDFRLETVATIHIQPSSMAVASDLVFLIEWDDDGAIRLREDRELGEVAERCRTLPFENCPDPLLLHRVDGGVTPSPS